MRSSVWLGMGAAWLCLLSIHAACDCDDEERFFECGVPVDGTATAPIRSCTGSKLVCICATNSCAKRGDTEDDCKSGYRYVDNEFADPFYRGRCVDDEVLTPRIEQGASVQACDSLPSDAGVDAPSDTPSDGVDAANDSAVDATVDAP